MHLPMGLLWSIARLIHVKVLRGPGTMSQRAWGLSWCFGGVPQNRLWNEDLCTRGLSRKGTQEWVRVWGGRSGKEKLPSKSSILDKVSWRVASAWCHKGALEYKLYLKVVLTTGGVSSQKLTAACLSRQNISSSPGTGLQRKGAGEGHQRQKHTQSGEEVRRNDLVDPRGFGHPTESDSVEEHKHDSEQ